MNKITSKIIESIESKYPYHPLINNRSVVTYYLDKCLSNVDENSEVMIINDNDMLKVNIELTDDSVISVACDENKVVGATNGSEAVANEPLFVIRVYGTKIICEECKKVDDNIVKTQGNFDYKEIECDIKETTNGEITTSGYIRSFESIIGENALFSVNNNINKKSKIVPISKDGITIDAMYDRLYSYIGYEPTKRNTKTL